MLQTDTHMSPFMPWLTAITKWGIKVENITCSNHGHPGAALKQLTPMIMLQLLCLATRASCQRKGALVCLMPFVALQKAMTSHQ
jgi:hypothetical protein